MFPFPALDCHAHIAPDVTAAQVRTLRGAQIFAMNRTLEETEAAVVNDQEGLTWGVGVHPGVAASGRQWTEERFLKAAAQTWLIGEVGMDRRAGGAGQEEILTSVLRITPQALISVHSTGCTSQVVRLIEKNPRPGVVLHWFTGTDEEAARAARAGCYFSINAAMSDEQMTRLPLERVLPETDFPSSKGRTGARAPGDTRVLEEKVSRLTRLSKEAVRLRWYQNLSGLAKEAGVQARMPAHLRALLDAAGDGRQWH